MALNAQPCAVKTRIGTRASAAANRPRIPAFELFRCTMSGPQRAGTAGVSSSRPSGSWTSDSSRRTWRSGMNGTPSSAAAVRTGPSPCGGHAHVELLARRGEQVADVGLRAADLGERHDIEESWTPAGHAPRVAVRSRRYDCAVRRPPTASERAIEPPVVARPSPSRARAARPRRAGSAADDRLRARRASWSSGTGAFAATVWYPIGLAVLAVAVTLALSARGQFAGLPRVTLAAIACLAAFTVWGFATILWASVRGDAWDGSNEALLYLLVFAVLAGWRATGRALWPAILALERGRRRRGRGHGRAGRARGRSVAVPDRLAALRAARLPERHRGALHDHGLAVRRARVAAAGCRPRRAASPSAWPGLNATLNLLTESRGSAYTLPAVVVAFLVLVPQPAPLAGGAGASSAVAVVPVVAAVLARLSATIRASSAAAIRHALYVGLLWSVAPRRRRVAVRRARRPRQPSPRSSCAAPGSPSSLAAVRRRRRLCRRDPPVETSSTRPGTASSTAGEPSGAASHFGGLGSNRYDFWRVGLIEFKRHPVQGIGVDNFLVPVPAAAATARRSRSSRTASSSACSRRRASSARRSSSAFLGLMVAAVFRIPRGPERDLAGILTVGGSVWILHGLVDWLWEMPVLGVLGMALLGAACGLAPRGQRRAPPWAPRLEAPAGGRGLAAALVAAASFALPWFAQRDVQQAATDWRTDPAAAFATLQSAHSLNPLDDQADRRRRGDREPAAPLPADAGSGSRRP